MFYDGKIKYLSMKVIMVSRPLLCTHFSVESIDIGVAKFKAKVKVHIATARPIGHWHTYKCTKNNNIIILVSKV